MSDFDHLLRKLPPGDPRLLETLVQQHYTPVYRLALAILCDPDDAGDVTQETFIQAGQNLHRYQPGTQLKSWLAAIAVNNCRALLRKRKARQRLADVLLVIGTVLRRKSTPEEALIALEADERLARAVASLDEKHRLPVILRYVHGLPVREVAAILNQPEGTIHSRLHYAHHKLRQQLGEAGEAGPLPERDEVTKTSPEQVRKEKL